MSFPGLSIGQLVLDKHQRVVSMDATFERVFGTVPPGTPLDDLISDRDRRGGTILAVQLNQYRAGSVIDLPLLLQIGGRDRYTRLRLLAEENGWRAFIEPADEPGSLTYETGRLRQRWTAIFNRSDDGIAVLDDGGALVEHNQRFLELLKLRSNHGILLSDDALLGRVLAEIVPADLASVAAALRATSGDFQLTVTSGIEQLDIKGRTLRAPGSNRTEQFLLVRDVTEQRQIEERDQLIRRDLERAARYQRSVLGKPPVIEGLRFGITYQPLDAVGGDVYDASLLGTGWLRLFIADATGHGIEAALATMLIKNEYDAVKKSPSPAIALRELNNRIATTHQKVATVFSGMVVDLDLQQNKLSYSNAGHPGAVLVRNGEVEELAEDGPLIGVRPNLVFPEWELDLEAWEALVLVTDGITDTRNSAGMSFGVAGLHAAVREALRRGRDIATEVRTHVDAFRGLAPAHDDVTALAVVRSAVVSNPRS